jgi:hypothetical protein
MNKAVPRPNTPLRIRLGLHPIICAIIIHANIPIIPPIECAEFIIPIEKPGNPLLPYFAIRITAELKKKAIPNPTMNRSQISCDDETTNPQRRAAAEVIIIPTIAEVRGLNLAAKIPAGIWNKPTPMKNAADIEPSRETSLSNSNAMSGNIADILNQFIPYTILATIRENDASASELNVPLFLFFVLIFYTAPSS